MGGPSAKYLTQASLFDDAADQWAKDRGFLSSTGIIRTLFGDNNLSELTDKEAARSNLGVVIGEDVQAYSPALDRVAAVNPSDLSLTLLSKASPSEWLLVLGEIESTAVVRSTTVVPIAIACSDETTALTTGTAKVTFRMPFAATLVGVKASLTTPQSSGPIFTVDINEDGTSVLSTKLTIDNTEKTSATAATAAVISDTVLADDAEMTVDIDQVGNGTAKGLKVILLVTQ